MTPLSPTFHPFPWLTNLPSAGLEQSNSEATQTTNTMTEILKIPYGDRTVHVDLRTSNSRSMGFQECVGIKMQKDGISYDQAFCECLHDEKLLPLVQAMKTRGQSISS